MMGNLSLKEFQLTFGLYQGLQGILHSNVIVFKK